MNIASRCAGFIERGGGRLAPALPEPGLYQEFAAAGERIATLYEAREYSAAMREIMELADRANRYIDQHKPWTLVRDPARADEVRAIATQGLNLFRVLMSCLAPVLPRMAKAAGEFLGSSFGDWSAIALPLLDRPIARYQPLATRLDLEAVASLIEPTPTAATGGGRQRPAARLWPLRRPSASMISPGSTCGSRAWPGRNWSRAPINCCA